MQRLNISRSFVALSAVTVALVPFSTNSEAKPKNKDKGGPPSHAPAWGYRGERGNSDRYGNNDSDYDDDDQDDYRNDRNGGRNGNGRGRVGRDDFGTLVTLEGVVTNTRDANEFEVRAGGRTFYVRSNVNVNVSNGDRVVLRGAFNNNEFNAQSVRVLRNNGDIFGGNSGSGTYGSGTSRSVDFPGTVTRVLSNREIEVRGDNGTVYRVQKRDTNSYIGVGSRVRVTGEASGTRIRNASVFSDGTSTNKSGGILGGIFNGGIFGNGNSNANVGRSVDFPALIISIDTGRDEAVVRGDNGRSYTVRGREVDGFRVGDRVRVRGVSQVGFIDLRDLDRI